ncbi:MAG TPA: hypothetical protein VEX17_03480 [Bacillales bacterium]|nr:hypothetical protein [Bacillales bacterium]
MGRWDDDRQPRRYGEGRRPRKNRNLPKLIRKIIYLGFIIVAVVVLAVFIPRAGLNIEVIHRTGDIETISTKISNNNFYPLQNVTIQYDNGNVQGIGDLGPFATIMLSPETQNINFEKITVKANNGQIESIKNR